MSLLTATRACLPGDDARRRLSPDDFPAFRAAFEACAHSYYRVSAGGRELPVRDAALVLTVEGDLDARVGYPRPAETPLVFDAIYLRRLMPRAGVVLTVTGARTFLGQKVLRPDDSVFEVPITAEAEAPGTPPLPSFRRYLTLGVEHILTGYDHLLFLFGLLVVCRRLRTVAAIVTCFTLAHSITLALAALNVVSLPARLVEPLIAASIVLVGVENLLRPDEPDGPWLSRWGTAFAFGLVHGLGFASALRGLGLGTAGTSVVGPLVAFNLGVEVGQLLVAALLMTVLLRIRRWRRLSGSLPRVASAGVVAVGLLWLLRRIFV